MNQERENYDNLAWDLNDDALENAQSQLMRRSFCADIVSVVSEQFGKEAILVPPCRLGGYNMLYRVRVDGLPSDVLVRVPCPSQCQFPKEKTLQEAATALLLQQRTQLPVPKLFQYETESTIGPLLMLQYIANEGDMSDVLSRPRHDTNEVPVLSEDLSEDMLHSMYLKLAKCILQLYQPEFSRIGSLNTESNGHISVQGRPITQNMSNMIQLANIPRDVLPSPTTTYTSAHEWYNALANMHLAQLVFQHNDLVTSEDDCRNKYISRYLFRQLAREEKLSSFGFAEDNWSAQAAKMKASCPAPDMTGRFRLWCDDLRPNNFLVNGDKDVVAVIDWEFTYAAPTQFILDPPWWLLLEMPEMWPAGIADWAEHYERGLGVWLSCMESAESTSTALPFKLHEYMRESWTTGRFWLSYAARKSWAFDAIYWKYLDARFFGERQQVSPDDPSWKSRINMLSRKDRLAMDAFVEKKMSDSVTRQLDSWSPDEVRSRMAEVLMEDDEMGF